VRLVRDPPRGSDRYYSSRSSSCCRANFLELQACRVDLLAGCCCGRDAHAHARTRAAYSVLVRPAARAASSLSSQQPPCHAGTAVSQPGSSRRPGPQEQPVPATCMAVATMSGMPARLRGAPPAQRTACMGSASTPATTTTTTSVRCQAAVPHSSHASHTHHTPAAARLSGSPPEDELPGHRRGGER
jgi:hypothetical protein